MRSVRRAVVVALLLVCALPGASSAQKKEDEEAFRQAWNQGIDAFNLGKYDEAWVHFERSAKLAPDKPGPYRYLGRTARALKKWEACVANATEAMRLNPDSKYSAEVVEDIRICREALGRPLMRGEIPEGQGAVAVISNVEGASVELDGIKKGATPMSPFPANPGKHTLHVERRGYLPLDLVIDVIPGIVIDVDAPLEADPTYKPDDSPSLPKADNVKEGWLLVQVDAQGTVTYRIDGKLATLGTDGTLVASPGIHSLEIEVDGYVPWRRRVVVVRGQKRGISVSMKKIVDRRRERVRAVVALSVAAVAGGTGAVFGFMENEKHEEARDRYEVERMRRPNHDLPPGLPESERYTREQIDEISDEGKKYGLISNISFGVAAAALGVGVYYLVQERTDDRRGYDLPMAFVPEVTPEGGIGATLVYSKELSF